MSAIKVNPRDYTSAAEMLAAGREVRARLWFGPPVPVNSILHPFHPTESPRRAGPDVLPIALTQPYRRVMMAVADAIGLAPCDVLGGLSEEARRARSIAAAVAIRRYLLRPDVAADRLGLAHDMVASATRTLDEVLSRTGTSVKWSDLGPFVALCVATWPTIEDIRADIPIQDIKRAFAKVFGVAVTELDSIRRHKSVVGPRQMAMAVMRHLTARSLPEIGRQFGGRDHTTVLYACQKYSALVERVAADLPATATAMDWALAMRAAT